MTIKPPGADAPKPLIEGEAVEKVEVAVEATAEGNELRDEVRAEIEAATAPEAVDVFLTLRAPKEQKKNRSIMEDRIIGKKEALDMLIVALEYVKEKRPLTLTEIFYDKNAARDENKMIKPESNILKIEIKATSEDGSYSIYTYQIKNDTNVDETNIDVADFDKDGMPMSGDVLYRYATGKWENVNSKLN